jgi:acetyl-CoA carboxylase carboxyl transferase subunit beta
MIFQKDLESSLFVCRHCGHHMPWPARARLNHLFGGSSAYKILPLPKVPADPLAFRDQKKYQDRLKEARAKTEFGEALVVAAGHAHYPVDQASPSNLPASAGASGQLTPLGGPGLVEQSHKIPVVAACFDFKFIGGSMGMAVGEGLLMAAEAAAASRSILLLIPSSGGARMQEGIFSLMQMPRSIIATQKARQAGVPIVVLLTHPTTGGVAASFAALGDLTVAEPGSIIGFTGARVIQETLRQPLPSGFQTAEFQKEHGFVDAIIAREGFGQFLGDLGAILHGRRSFLQQPNLRPFGSVC